MGQTIRQTLKILSAAPDLIPQDAPLDVWNVVQNVAFRIGESQRVSGDSLTLVGQLTVPKCMVFLESDDVGYWLYAGDDGVFVANGTTHFDITPAGGWTPGINSVWTATVIAGLGVINCSTLDPVFWDGNTSNPTNILPDWPTGGRCNAMRVHKNFLFAIGFISEGGERVRWSDAAEPGTIPQFWLPAPTNLAGFIDLAPLYSECLDGMTLRDDMYIYKGLSIWALTFIGGDFVFASRKVFAERGIAGTNAVTRGLNDEHLFVGFDGDVYLTDGVQVQSILDGRAQQTFYDDFTSEKTAIFSAVTLPRDKVGAIIYPRASSTLGDQMLMFDFSSGAIGFRFTPDVLCAAEGPALTDVGTVNQWDGDPDDWQDDLTSWNQVVSGQTRNDIMLGGGFGFLIGSDPTAIDFVTGPVQARLEKHGLAFGDAERYKMIQRVWPKIIGRAGDIITFRLGGQQITGGPITWAPPVDFVIGTDPSHLDTFVTGRFLSMEISSDGGAPWAMGSIDLEFVEQGKW